MDDNVRLWLEFTNADMETASFLYDKQYPRQFEIICYHCQRAGEKAIKALYAYCMKNVIRQRQCWLKAEKAICPVIPKSEAAETGPDWPYGTELIYGRFKYDL